MRFPDGSADSNWCGRDRVTRLISEQFVTSLQNLTHASSCFKPQDFNYLLNLSIAPSKQSCSLWLTLNVNKMHCQASCYLLVQQSNMSNLEHFPTDSQTWTTLQYSQYNQATNINEGFETTNNVMQGQLNCDLVLLAKIVIVM